MNECHDEVLGPVHGTWRHLPGEPADLTTLKIYQTDGLQHERMNEESEHFRRITLMVPTIWI